MIQLNIKNADGSHYWTENFNTQADCDKWLAEEKTRPYWKQSFVTDQTVIQTGPTPEQIAADKTKADAKKAKLDALSQLKKSDLKDAATIADVLLDVIKQITN